MACSVDQSFQTLLHIASTNSDHHALCFYETCPYSMITNFITSRSDSLYESLQQLILQLSCPEYIQHTHTLCLLKKGTGLLNKNWQVCLYTQDWKVASAKLHDTADFHTLEANKLCAYMVATYLCICNIDTARKHMGVCHQPNSYKQVHHFSTNM